MKSATSSLMSRCGGFYRNRVNGGGDSNKPRVILSNGCSVIGRARETTAAFGAGEFVSFTKIPYAKPPIGKADKIIGQRAFVHPTSATQRKSSLPTSSASRTMARRTQGHEEVSETVADQQILGVSCTAQTVWNISEHDAYVVDGWEFPPSATE